MNTMIIVSVSTILVSSLLMIQEPTTKPSLSIASDTITSTPAPISKDHEPASLHQEDSIHLTLPPSSQQQVRPLLPALAPTSTLNPQINPPKQDSGNFLPRIDFLSPNKRPAIPPAVVARKMHIPLVLPSSDKKLPGPDSPKPDKEVRLLTLHHTDDQQAVQQFVDALEMSGLKIDLKTDYTPDQAYISSFFIRFRHRKGLNFRLRAIGFKKLDIRLFLDQDGRIDWFRYRINDKEFTYNIYLNARGHQKYFLGDGVSAQTGLTNIPIER
ncbi:MAG: hypothetical protein AAF587_21215 [Bacteroidota bacterium]